MAMLSQRTRDGLVSSGRRGAFTLILIAPLMTELVRAQIQGSRWEHHM